MRTKSLLSVILLASILTGCKKNYSSVDSNNKSAQVPVVNPIHVLEAAVVQAEKLTLPHSSIHVETPQAYAAWSNVVVLSKIIVTNTSYSSGVRENAANTLIRAGYNAANAGPLDRKQSGDVAADALSPFFSTNVTFKLLTEPRYNLVDDLCYLAGRGLSRQMKTGDDITRAAIWYFRAVKYGLDNHKHGHVVADTAQTGFAMDDLDRMAVNPKNWRYIRVAYNEVFQDQLHNNMILSVNHALSAPKSRYGSKLLVAMQKTQ